MIVYDRTAYYNAVRGSLFGGDLSQQQVDGQNAILAVWEDQYAGPSPMTDPRWLAYMLATVYWECAQTMWPIEEYGKGKGKKYGVKDPETGNVFYGRGFVMMTWKENYQRATEKLNLHGDRDLVWHPEHALDLDIASMIMFRGMSEGWFTGKRLGQYFNLDTNDPVNARIIINNDVSKMGQKIAGFHKHFLAALTASAEVVSLPEQPIDPDVPPQVVVAVSVPVGVDVVFTLNGVLVS